MLILNMTIVYSYVFLSSGIVIYQWQNLLRLTSHHGRVEAPEAEGQDFSFYSDTLPMFALWSNNETLGIRNIRWDLIGPSITLLKSYTIVFSKSTQTEDIRGAAVQQFLSTALAWHEDLASFFGLFLTCNCLCKGSPKPWRGFWGWWM